MPSIVLLMWRAVIAESLLAELKKEPGIQLFYEPEYSRADVIIRNHKAEVALIEAAETGDRDVSCCLRICASLRKEADKCKLILMCPDNDEEAVAQTVNAKHNGRIDDFVFYEASFDYISSKLLTMLQS